MPSFGPPDWDLHGWRLYVTACRRTRHLSGEGSTARARLAIDSQLVNCTIKVSRERPFRSPQASRAGLPSSTSGFKTAFVVSAPPRWNYSRAAVGRLTVQRSNAFGHVTSYATVWRCLTVCHVTGDQPRSVSVALVFHLSTASPDETCVSCIRRWEKIIGPGEGRIWEGFEGEECELVERTGQAIRWIFFLLQSRLLVIFRSME